MKQELHPKIKDKTYKSCTLQTYNIYTDLLQE